MDRTRSDGRKPPHLERARSESLGGIVSPYASNGNGGGRPALAHALEGADSLLILSHMNPDPDTIGAALGMRLLLTERYSKKVNICYRGIIGRAENRQLVRLVGDRMLHARQINQAQYQGSVMVDCQPDYALCPEIDRLPVLAVIDHHPICPSTARVAYSDVRPHYGATSTIVSEYLLAERVEPGAKVATALFYGLKTDTQDLSRRTSPADVKAYEWLLPRIDRGILSQIENPPLSRDYFDEFVTAVSRAVTYRNVILTELGQMAYPDMVAEIADRLLRLEGMEWAICFGMHEQRIYLSVRTTLLSRDAGELVKTVLGGDGAGGGHDTMAAGRVQLLDDSEETYLRRVKDLWNRFLDALGEDANAGRRMVSDPSFGLRVCPEEP